MPKKKPERDVPKDLFGDPIEEPRRPRNGIMPLEFESHRVRMLLIRGEPWWVAADVCRVLDIGNVTDAVSRLDDDERTTLDNTEGGGRAHTLNIINESGLYSLVLTSRKPEAKRFKRWITHEVLPAIRRTGTYTVRNRDDRINEVARRLKVDRMTAKIRCDQIALNRSMHLRMVSEGAVRKNFPDRHNATYRGQFGSEAPQIRKALGLRSCRHSPLDHMAPLVLAQNWHSKLLAEHRIRESDPDMSQDDQNRVFEQSAREIRQADFDRLKAIGDHAYGIVDDPVRGKIIGIVRRQLPKP